MANFYNLGSMFCCSLTIVTLGYCVLLAIEQCFDVKQMADVRFLTQGQAGSKLSQRYVEAPIAICNVSQHQLGAPTASQPGLCLRGAITRERYALPSPKLTTRRLVAGRTRRDAQVPIQADRLICWTYPSIFVFQEPNLKLPYFFIILHPTPDTFCPPPTSGSVFQ